MSNKEQKEKHRYESAHQKEKKAPIYRKRHKLDRDEIVSNLTGRTLMIYFVLLNKKTIGVRELQRHLELSSPSVAKYHLEKLVDLHLVENRNGIYHLDHKADLPLLTSWVLVGKILFPKVMFAAIFFSTLFIGYLLFIYSNWNKDSIFVILLGCGIMIYIWLDVIFQFKHKPI
ncbi:MAG: hypothetical protein ACFE96_02590 [Candidatus Hermodarchaeota archaeon]